MPVYTYRCEECGVQFDRSQKFSEQPLTRCPECGKKSLRKVYQPVGIVFKGSGWYITDSRKSSSATVASDEANAKSDTKTDTKADSTPDTSSKSSGGDTAATPAPASGTKSSSDSTAAKT